MPRPVTPAETRQITQENNSRRLLGGVDDGFQSRDRPPCIEVTKHLSAEHVPASGDVSVELPHLLQIDQSLH